MLPGKKIHQEYYLDSHETDMPPEKWVKFAFEKLKRCRLKAETEQISPNQTGHTMGDE
jgi:hypothetical protein